MMPWQEPPHMPMSRVELVPWDGECPDYPHAHLSPPISIRIEILDDKATSCIVSQTIAGESATPWFSGDRVELVDGIFMEFIRADFMLSGIQIQQFLCTNIEQRELSELLHDLYEEGWELE